MISPWLSLALCNVTDNFKYAYNWDSIHYYVEATTGVACVWLPEAFDISVTPIKVVGVLATPIETPLSAEELAQFSALRSPSGNVTVFSEANISVALSEFASTSSVDRKFEDANATILQQSASIRTDTESIVLSVKESSVQRNEYEEYKESVTAELEALANQIIMKFNANTETINSVNSDLQSKFAEVYKHITFDLDGITIGAGENAVKMNLDNDQLIFSKGGLESVRLDINDFRPANVTMANPGSKLTIGNFAWEVQEDGTPMFVKVGG